MQLALAHAPLRSGGVLSSRRRANTRTGDSTSYRSPCFDDSPDAGVARRYGAGHDLQQSLR
jgi:hypothetical protein